MQKNGIASMLKRFVGDLPIRYKLISAFLLLALIPVTGIAYLSFTQSNALIQEETSRYTMDILNETSKNIEFKLREIDQISRIVFLNKDVQHAIINANAGFKDVYEEIGTSEKIRMLLRKTVEANADIDSVYIISNTGTTFNINLSVNSFHITDEIRKQAKAGDGKSVWCNTDAKTKTIPLVRTVNDLTNFKKIGYLVINIKERGLSEIYSKNNLSRSGDLYIINKYGNIMSHMDKGLLGQKQVADYIPKILYSNPQSGFFIHAIDQKNHYIASYPIMDTDFKIVSIIPSIEYERKIILLRNGIITIAFICWLFAAIISFYFSASISKPIHRLYVMMNKVGKGDFNINSTCESRDEIGMLNLHFNNMVKQINTLIQEVYQEQLMKQKAELKSLKMQINPHFLYNTLESINWLARENGVNAISKMVKALGDLMRTSIGGEDFITLEEELRNIKNYITIQKYRYGDKLTVEFALDPQVSHVRVPKLIIQPLVENSIIHGIERKQEKGVITIRSCISEGNVVISVSDNGPGIKPEQLKTLLDESDDKNHTRIGIININRRIKLYYGEEYGVCLQSKYREGTEACIVIPYAHLH